MPTPADLFKPDDDRTIATRLPENVTETDFADETVKGNDLPAYKGRANVTDRIGIINPTKILVGRTHFRQGMGYILCSSEFKLNGTNEVLHKAAPCCLHLEPESESTKRVTCLVIKYDTKPDGVLVEPFGYKLLLWRFSEDKYEQLKNINKEWPLAEHDLLATCSEEKYQRIAFNICKQSIFRGEKFQKAFGGQVNDWVEFMRPKMVKSMGKKLTAQELMEKLGKAQSPAMVSPAMDSPISDIADLLQGTE